MWDLSCRLHTYPVTKQQCHSGVGTCEENVCTYISELTVSCVIILTVVTCWMPSVLRHCWLGDRKGIRPVKSWVSVCWWWRFDWSFARPIAPIITTTSITLCSNKIQNGDILVTANPGPPGKWWLKGARERESSLQVPDWSPEELLVGKIAVKTCGWESSNVLILIQSWPHCVFGHFDWFLLLISL